MSANQCPKDMHASILSAVEEATDAIMSGKMTHQRSIGAATNFTSIRFLKYAKGVMVGVASLLALMVVLAFLKFQFGTTTLIVSAPILLVGWLVFIWRVSITTASNLTWQELDSLRTAMILTDDQATYLDCIDHLERNCSVDKVEVDRQRSELTEALDRILRSDDSAGTARKILGDYSSTNGIGAQ